MAECTADNNNWVYVAGRLIQQLSSIMRCMVRVLQFFSCCAQVEQLCGSFAGNSIRKAD